MEFKEAKLHKLTRIRALLRDDMPYVKSESNYNFLSDSMKETYNITDTENVSAHNYDPYALNIIEECKDGFVLDCGCGKRAVYYDNVVNFEIVPYDTTDVLGVGEKLPFKSNSFDGMLSLNVLEHVKDPFECASEISRVMKPGAKIYCVAGFLSPVHAFPHHYYNMTSLGLNNLFSNYLAVNDQLVIASGLPIWTLQWILRSWTEGLDEATKEEFLKMTVQELIRDPMEQLDKNFVRNLSHEKNMELACTTALFATKMADTTEKTSGWHSLLNHFRQKPQS